MAKVELRMKVLKICRLGANDMPIKKDDGETPVRGEAGLLLLLVVFGLCGLLTWTGLFLSVKWSLSTAWTAMVAHQAAASSAQIPLALSATPAAVP
jgi:hypothetical protein